MKETIRNILEELYTSDPSLQEYDRELKAFLKSIIRFRPEPQRDPNFPVILRRRIMKEAERFRSMQKHPSPFRFLNIFSMKKVSIGAGVFAAMVLAVSSVLYFSRSMSRTDMKVTGDLYASNIVAVADNAFGSLRDEARDPSPARSQSGGGRGAPTAVSGPVAAPEAIAEGPGLPVSADIASSRTMIYPFEPVYYSYVYDGEELSLPSGKLPVYRRVKGDSQSSQVRGILGQLNFSSVNFTTFTNIKVQSLNFYEDKEYGYTIFVDFFEGAVNISEHWEKWPHPGSDCFSEDCYRKNRIQESDIPEDGELIRIAGGFLFARGISTAFFGEPEVSSDWRIFYERTVPPEDFYLPEVISIVYPLEIDGLPVFDEGGNPNGMTVNINIREKRVSGVWGITTQQYEKSEYEAVSDIQDVFDIAYRGGLYGWYPEYENARTVEVRLGTPTKGLLRTAIYLDGVHQDIFVPAFIFPVSEQPNGDPYFYRRAVVVPLVREFFENSIVPMPLLVPSPVGVQTEPGVISVPAAPDKLSDRVPDIEQ